jgi:uncharacterized membrane protein YgcG
VPARTRRLITRALLAAVLGLTAAFAVACGSSGSGKGLLSADESRTISSALDGVSSAVRAHSCSRTKTALNALDASLQNLPGANAKLVRNLAHGASTVSQAALTQCAHPVRTTSTTSSTTSTTSTVVTTTTATRTTPSVPTTQSTPTTPSTPATTPATTPSTTTPGNGNGNGNGGGNGNGNGNGNGGGGGAGLTGQGSGSQ